MQTGEGRLYFGWGEFEWTVEVDCGFGDVGFADQRDRILGNVENMGVFEVDFSGCKDKVIIKLVKNGFCLTAFGIIAAGFGLFVDFNRNEAVAAIVRRDAEAGGCYQQQER